MTTLRLQQLIIDIPGRSDGTALDLEIGSGERWAVLGPNGAGKTTLLLTLAGLHRARSGRVILNDTNIRQMRRKHLAQRLAIVFQERQDGFPSTVLESVMMGRHPFLAPWDVESEEDLQIGLKALETLDLLDKRDQTVNTLSGGERQRLSIATALAQTPDIWLVDEPSNHLDLHHQVGCMSLLQAQADAGKSIVVCTHDINLAARWSSHILLLYPDGKACWGQSGTMLELHALETLYQQALKKAMIDGQAFFIPA